MSKAMAYHFPVLYEAAMTVLQAGSVKKMRKIVGKNTSVFEVACGYGRVKRQLHSSVQYSGIDLNQDFVDYGKKKGIDIKLGDIFDKSKYKKSEIILLCDLVHHLTIKQNKELFKIMEPFAQKKIIIFEPRICTLASKKNIFSRIIAKIFSAVDRDGVNEIDKWLSDKEYRKLFDDMFKESSRIESYTVKMNGLYYQIEYNIK
jgi:SAM-dependent methyltransferase